MYKYLLFRLFTHLGSKLFSSRYPTESRVSHIVSLSRYLKFRDAFIASRATFPRRCFASAVSSAFETCLAPRIRADCLDEFKSVPDCVLGPDFSQSFSINRHSARDVKFVSKRAVSAFRWQGNILRKCFPSLRKKREK